MRIRSLLWLVAALAVLAGLAVFLGLRSYRVFTEEELVAIVRCEPIPGGSVPKGISSKGGHYRFLLLYTPVTRGVSGITESFPMQGDQWMVGGDFLKWHPWLNLLGIKNRHKLTRLSSRYLKIEEEKAGPRSVYELNGGTDLLWQNLYRVGHWVPFVEAVYGNAAYTFATPGSQWGIYVTHSGYLIKPQALFSGTKPKSRLVPESML